jgi:NAD(P)-dependent dehydrogenase (short-subunit alcohol dehydrogenase family)
MPTELKDKIVLVTGGGSGIGRLMCLRFAQEGSIVVTCDIRMGLIEEVQQQQQQQQRPHLCHVPYQYQYVAH